MDRKKQNRRKVENIISKKQINALKNYKSKFNEWLRKTGEPQLF